MILKLLATPLFNLIGGYDIVNKQDREIKLFKEDIERKKKYEPFSCVN